MIHFSHNCIYFHTNRTHSFGKCVIFTYMKCFCYFWNRDIKTMLSASFISWKSWVNNCPIFFDMANVSWLLYATSLLCNQSYCGHLKYPYLQYQLLKYDIDYNDDNNTEILLLNDIPSLKICQHIIPATLANIRLYTVCMYTSTGRSTKLTQSVIKAVTIFWYFPVNC